MLLGELQGKLDASLPAGGSQPITCSPRWGCDLLDDPTPGGSTVPVFRQVMDWMTPLSRNFGPEMNRDTVANVQAAGFIVENFRRGEARIDFDAERFRLGRQPAADIAQRHDVVAVVQHPLREGHKRDIQ